MTPPPGDRRAVLADLQQRIRALESGERPDGAPRSPGERRRMVSLEVAIRLRREAERAARRRRAEFEAALDAILDRTRFGTAAIDRTGTTASPPPPPPWDDRQRLQTGLDQILQRIQQRANAGLGHPDGALPAPAPEHIVRHWSPTAIPGYRVWAVRSRLHGVYRAWETRRYVAGCLGVRGATERQDDEVPHTDGRCGHPPCGLYAAKDPLALDVPALQPPARRRIAVGLVALSGKVVEHEHGYRARCAEVVALVVVGGGVVVRIGDSATIDRMFADPASTLESIEASRPHAVEPMGTGPSAGLDAAARFLRSRLWPA